MLLELIVPLASDGFVVYVKPLTVVVPAVPNDLSALT